MNIERDIRKQLLAWKVNPARKPLVLQGARQVGKTWLLKDFGKQEFDSMAYFSFDEDPELKQFFKSTKDVSRIIQNLALVYGKPIIPGKTLIIFDEIQECNEALNSLKYFCDNAPEYAVASAGSLLGVALSRGESFPVGKVDFIDMHPITFTEFLKVSDEGLAAFCNSNFPIEPIPDLLFSRLVDKFKMYLISGGMPEAVTALLEKQDLELTQTVLSNILRANTPDFSKHTEYKDIVKIGYVWASIPAQLARENKKFLYQAAKPGARAREYEDALGWLEHAGLVHKIYRNTTPGLPLSRFDDLSSFKLYLYDVGLLRRMSFLDPIAIKEGNRLFTEFKGSLSENYILQSIITQFEVVPRYWSSGNQAEVDFLIQYQNQIIPVEVKSGESIRGKSLSLYRKQFQPSISIRFSLQNLRLDNGLLIIPLFLADQTKRILEEIE